MIKQRFITGISLGIIILLLIIFLPARLFFYLATMIFLFAAWEWSILIEISHKLLRALYVIFIAATLLGIQYISIKLVLSTAIIWWLFALVCICLYPKGAELWSRHIGVRACMGLFTLAPCWLSLNFIRAAQNGVSIVIFLLFLVWASDTGAYLFGRWKGKHLLMPDVSPKKTWEGVMGGVIFGLLIAIGGLALLQVSLSAWPIALGVSFVTIVFGIMGDLFESMMKRRAGLKDMGHYLPGHGGILDRIDSITAAAPIFLLGCLIFGLS